MSNHFRKRGEESAQDRLVEHDGVVRLVLDFPLRPLLLLAEDESAMMLQDISRRVAGGKSRSATIANREQSHTWWIDTYPAFEPA